MLKMGRSRGALSRTVTLKTCIRITQFSIEEVKSAVNVINIIVPVFFFVFFIVGRQKHNELSSEENYHTEMSAVAHMIVSTSTRKRRQHNTHCGNSSVSRPPVPYVDHLEVQRYKVTWYIFYSPGSIPDLMFVISVVGHQEYYILQNSHHTTP